jgi:hypothetical protein
MELVLIRLKRIRDIINALDSNSNEFEDTIDLLDDLISDIEEGMNEKSN